MRRLIAVLAAWSIAAGCGPQADLAPVTSPPTTRIADGPAPINTSTSTSTSTLASPSTTELERDCTPQAADLPEPMGSADPGLIAAQLSRATFRCADDVTVAPADEAGAAAAAAIHAAEIGGPLLLITDAAPGTVLAEEIERLDPRTIWLAGTAAAGGPAYRGREVERVTGRAVLPDTTSAETEPVRLIVVGPQGAAAWPAVWSTATSAGDTAILAGDGDLRLLDPRRAAAVRETGLARATLIGFSGSDAAWQLAVVRSGRELPGGGLLMFPDRRLVAFYGHPELASLGALGEQGATAATATLDRMAPTVEEYAADGVETLPAFEIIATVAAVEAGPDGDYSEETDPEVIRPWVETAAAQGAYVILDLQPGRSGFLSQARIYEEFIRLPHVGLALDPEWRLEADQFHLRQIGSVEAAEINRVSAWLAGIVREEALPQKLLLLHQFRLDMIPDRASIEPRPELAIAIQMDGQGPLGSKVSTWRTITEEPDAAAYWWGWKNFYDEDDPMATAADVLSLEPTVYYVSFQ